MELLSSVFTAGVYTTRLYLLNHLFKDIKSFRHSSVLDASLYEQLQDHNKKEYGGLSWMRAMRVQETAMLSNTEMIDIECLSK